MPKVAPPGRGQLGLTEARSHFIHAGSLPGIGIPGQHVLPPGRLDWGKASAAGIARAGGIKQRALGGASPRKKLAPAQCGVAPSAHALGKQGPLVLGHGGADLSQALRMRSLPPGALDTLDTAATWGECIDQEPLRHLGPCAALGRSHQHACKGGHRGPVSESVKPGTLERGATGAVIAIEGLVGNRPIRVERHGGVQAAAWLLNRLRLGLTTGRDPHGESDFHGIPPDGALVQGSGLRSVP
jgi:hypothetical protein